MTTDQHILINEVFPLASKVINFYARKIDDIGRDRDSYVSALDEKICTATRTYNPCRGPYRPYILRGLKQEVIRVFRNRDRQRKSQVDINLYDLRDNSSITNPVERCILRETRANVRRILAKIDPSYREIIFLRIWRNMSFCDISARLGITRQCVQYHYKNALLAIRKTYEK